MSELKRRKFDRIMNHRDSLEYAGARAISLLNNAVDQAVEFSILLEEDPDDYFTSSEDKDEIRQDYEKMMNSLKYVLPKIELIRQLKDEEITIEEFKTKTGMAGFDVVKYQARLSKSNR